MADKKKKSITYADSGVDIDAGNKAVQLIEEMVERTYAYSQYKILTNIGGFGAVVELPDGRIVVVSMDGVGTKIIIAILLNIHNTVGIDLVAMCANDVLTAGIPPSVFLDYLAMGKQTPELTVKLVEGIVKGCRHAQCALIGGEMAELPGMYPVGEYDMAGVAIGFAKNKDTLILGDAIRPGMKVYGLPSSGLHSNAFSLCREIFNIYPNNDDSVEALQMRYAQLGGKTLGEELLTPTKIYTKEVMNLIDNHEIAGLVNITGGGLVDNPPRVLPNGCGMVIHPNSWELPPIFKLVQSTGNVAPREMRRTTNCGIGFMFISPDKIQEEGILHIGKIIPFDSKKVLFKNRS